MIEQSPTLAPKPQGPRLFIIDTMAMIFRSYHAFKSRPLSTTKGLPTSATFGCLQTLLGIIEREAPEYLVLANDSPGPNFRHALFPEYKAHRGEMPPELKAELPQIFELFSCLQIPLIQQSGLEADDLIGSLCHKFAGAELAAVIFSGDKDFAQLVNQHVFLCQPKKNQDPLWLNVQGVKEVYGIYPHQVIDYLCMVGDTADNIPGYKGIGDKGAAKLLEAYGSLEKIHASIKEIKNQKYQNALESGSPRSALLRQLTTIRLDAPIGFSLEDLRLRAAKALAEPEILDFCRKYEFMRVYSTLAERQGLSSQAQPSTPKKLPKTYTIIRTYEAWEKLRSQLEQASAWVLDTETTGLDLKLDQPIGLSFSLRPTEAYYIPLEAPHFEAKAIFKLKAELKALLESPSYLKIGHNIKFDKHMLGNLAINLAEPFFDTMVAAWMTESNLKSYSLDELCKRQFDFSKTPTEALIGTKEKISMREVPLEVLGDYACEDADFTYRLYEQYKPRLVELGLEELYTTLEMPFLALLQKMEQEGVYTHEESLIQLSETLDTRARALEEKVREYAGESFNLNSPKQVGHILFEKLKLQLEGDKNIKLKTTKTGYSTDVSVLEAFSEYPIVAAILEHRHVTKIKNTFVDTLPQLMNIKDSRIHSSFHQTGTATGRLSSSQPNLQNIPIRGPLGKDIRAAFRAQKSENRIISADYSQIELRILAHLSEDPGLLRAFTQDADIHRDTAAKIFSLPPEKVSSDQRSAAKAINFGIIYGMGPKRLAKTTGTSFTEAKLFIERYFEIYPEIKDYITKAQAFADQHEYTLTMCGRRRPLPEIHSKNAMLLANAKNIAVNSPIQGSAADLIKFAMLRIDQDLRKGGFSTALILQVHDELVFEGPQSEVQEASQLIALGMTQAMTLKVPLKVEIGSGTNWLEAH